MAIHTQQQQPLHDGQRVVTDPQERAKTRVPLELPWRGPTVLPDYIDQQAIYLSGYAYLKLLFWRDIQEKEVSCWGVMSPISSYLITDFVLVHQRVSGGFTEMQEEHIAFLADYFQDHANMPMGDWLTHWFHTHPKGMGPTPSGVDNNTFNSDRQARANVSAMAILSKQGEFSCRLRTIANGGPFNNSPRRVVLEGEMPVRPVLGLLPTDRAIDPRMWLADFRELVFDQVYNNSSNNNNYNRGGSSIQSWNEPHQRHDQHHGGGNVQRTGRAGFPGETAYDANAIESGRWPPGGNGAASNTQQAASTEAASLYPNIIRVPETPGTLGELYEVVTKAVDRRRVEVDFNLQQIKLIVEGFRDARNWRRCFALFSRASVADRNNIRTQVRDAFFKHSAQIYTILENNVDMPFSTRFTSIFESVTKLEQSIPNDKKGVLESTNPTQNQPIALAGSAEVPPAGRAVNLLKAPEGAGTISAKKLLMPNFNPEKPPRSFGPKGPVLPDCISFDVAIEVAKLMEEASHASELRAFEMIVAAYGGFVKAEWHDEISEWCELYTAQCKLYEEQTPTQQRDAAFIAGMPPVAAEKADQKPQDAKPDDKPAPVATDAGIVVP